MTTSRIQTWYQNPKKHLILAQFGNSPKTRLSWVAPDTVVQRAMRHSSPETKRRYQLGMVEQVRQNLEKANKRVYGKGRVLRFYDVPHPAEDQQGAVVSK